MGKIDFEITCEDFFEHSGDLYFSYEGKDENEKIVCSGVESIEREMVNSKNAVDLMLKHLNENIDRITNKRSIYELNPLLRALISQSNISDSGMVFIEKSEFDSPDEIPTEKDLDALQDEISSLGLDDYFDILSPSSVSENEAFITVYMGVSSDFDFHVPEKLSLEKALEGAESELYTGCEQDIDEQEPDILR